MSTRTPLPIDVKLMHAVASGLFACPGGVTKAGDHWGSALFA